MKKKILIVEDDEINSKLFVDIFSYCNYEVKSADNYQEAVSIIESEIFDVMLMDIQLAGASSINIVRRIRKKDIKTPIIAITAFAVEGEEVQKILNCGFNDCVLKPTTITKLTETIAKYT